MEREYPSCPVDLDDAPAHAEKLYVLDPGTLSVISQFGFSCNNCIRKYRAASAGDLQWPPAEFVPPSFG